MALWMEAGSKPTTEKERVDLDAIAALKESAAIELKEKGNQYVKMGKKHYTDAIDCYSRAINQKVLCDLETSILFANRAHVNLLLGNYRHGLTDAKEAIKLCPSNVKAIYRAAKASFSLKMLTEAKSYCEKGLVLDPNNEEMMKLGKQIDVLKSEQDQCEAQVSKAVMEAKELISAIEGRGLMMGKAMFRELTGLKKPVLDKNNIIHWPVLLLYAEFMSCDFIEDFCETDLISAHLDIMFSDSPLLPWDEENNYTRDSLEIYYEAGSGVFLSKSKLLQYLLEGTVGSHVECVGDEESDASESPYYGNSTGPCKWIKVNEKETLCNVLKESDFIIPGIPVFYVVSKRSSFYREFKAGKWAPPP